MSRDSFSFDPRDIDARVGRPEGTSDQASRSKRYAPPDSGSEPPRHAQADRQLTPENQDRPRAYELGHRTFPLRESEVQAMADLGTFRVVSPADLARYAYSGDIARMEREVRRLRGQGLVVERTLPTSGRNSFRVLGLTRTGKRLLCATNRLPENQAIYHGIVKLREAKHDAELYRLFHAELKRIQGEGGRPLRVILDYELKRLVNRERERLGERRNDPLEVRAIAERNGLTTVEGKIPLPDLRLEYQTADLELQCIDLELATRHYRPRGLAAKTKAGFALYSPREDARRLRRILDEQELTARIFAL